MSDQSATSKRPSAKTEPVAPSPVAGSVFDNLADIRLSPETTGSAREVLVRVPVKKPGRAEFVRVHPDPAMSIVTAVYVDAEERETYFIAPAMRAELAGEAKAVNLVTAITRQGVLFFWPVPVPAEGASPNAWWLSSIEAAGMAQAKWCRVAADMALGSYRIYAAEGELSDPVWPTQTLQELLVVAFKDKVIASADHPIVKRLRGLV
jgi:hypothetical protein